MLFKAPWLRNRIYIAIAIAVAVAGLAAAGEIYQLRSRLSRESAARVDADKRVLAAKGWLEALAVDAEEVGTVTPDIPPSGIGVPALGTRFEGTVTFERPDAPNGTRGGTSVPDTGEPLPTCPVAVLPPASGTGESGPAQPRLPAFSSIDLSIDAQVSVTMLEDGSLHGKPSLWVNLLAPWEDRRPARVSSFDLVVSDDLARTIRRGLQPADRFSIVPRRPSRWRLGWSAGAGLCSDFTGQASFCGAVIWGGQF